MKPCRQNAWLRAEHMACAQVVNIFLHVSVESEVSQPWILLKRGEAELQTETMPALDTAHFRTPHFLRSLSLSLLHIRCCLYLFRPPTTSSDRVKGNAE